MLKQPHELFSRICKDVMIRNLSFSREFSSRKFIRVRTICRSKVQFGRCMISFCCHFYETNNTTASVTNPTLTNFDG